jgi:hypothetical protein
VVSERRSQSRQHPPSITHSPTPALLLPLRDRTTANHQLLMAVPLKAHACHRRFWRRPVCIRCCQRNLALGGTY